MRVCGSTSTITEYLSGSIVRALKSPCKVMYGNTDIRGQYVCKGLHVIFDKDLSEVVTAIYMGGRQMLIYTNLIKLNDEHFDLLMRLYDLDKDVLLALPEKEISELLFPEGDSPLWSALLLFDNNKPLPDNTLAEQICDILRPVDIYHPEEDESI